MTRIFSIQLYVSFHPLRFALLIKWDTDRMDDVAFHAYSSRTGNEDYHLRWESVLSGCERFLKFCWGSRVGDCSCFGHYGVSVDVFGMKCHRVRNQSPFLDWNPRTKYRSMSVRYPIYAPVLIIFLPIKVSISPFDSLRTIAVTGAVLTAPVMEWTHKAFGGDKHLLSTSGGTDVCGASESFPNLLPWGRMECWWSS